MHHRLYQFCLLGDIRLGLGLVTLPHMLYTYCTTSPWHTIRVKDKYLYTENGFTKFMIVTADDEHFCVNNSMWHWKWDCIEEWAKMKKGGRYHARYYGRRIPCLSLFPNIFAVAVTPQN